MSERALQVSVLGVAVLFTIFFCSVVMPPLMEDPDILGAFAAGFVNPFAAGYSADVIACWLVLALWVLFEAKVIRYGWVCLVLGVVPGVAVGFATYLVLRSSPVGIRIPERSTAEEGRTLH